jgi:hypothetical protein
MSVPQWRHSTARGFERVSLWWMAGALYVSTFWGNAQSHLPAPWSRWGAWCRPTIHSWWNDQPYMWLLAQLAIGVGIPALVVLLLGLSFTGIGWRRPNRLGWRWMAVATLAGVPFGLWLFLDAPDTAKHIQVNAHYVAGLLALLPEHFLICGLLTAVFLPGARFPEATLPTTSEQPTDRANRVARSLRWLGLFQPPTERDQATTTAPRLIRWLGIDAPGSLAVVASGSLFALGHVGKAPLELILSFPGGMAVAYITLRSQSVWPALVAHVGLNVIPLAMLMAAQGLRGG